MSIFKQFATSKEKETHGVEIKYAPNEDGTIPSFTVSRICKTNKKYTKTMEQATRPYRRVIDNDTIEEKVAERIYLEVFVDAILMGWENIISPVGERIPYTRENALNLFTELPELYIDLQDHAKKISLFTNEELEQDAKNL